MSSSSAHNHQNPPTPLFNSLLKTNWKKKIKTNNSNSTLHFAGNNISPPSAADKTQFYSRTKQVILNDWWLLKVNVEGPNAFKLGVGGNASDGRASTYFCSGEIVKRHDEMTLETVDGLTVILTGLINRSRTLENGFTSKVCNNFVFGFPFDWEEFGAQYIGEESIHGAHSSKGTRMSLDDIDDAKSSLSISFDDLPVTRLFDHNMLSSGDYNKCTLTRSVFDHILSEYGSFSAELNEEDTDKIITKDCLPNETGTPLHASEEDNRPVMGKCCPLDKALRDHLEDNDDNGILNAVPIRTDDFSEIHSQSTMDEDVHKHSNYVFTRSKTRSETLKNYRQEGLSSKTSTYTDTTTRTTVKQHGDTITITNAANVSQSPIPNAEYIEVDRVLDSSIVDNFSKPKHLGNDVAARRGTVSTISMSNQEQNFSSATLNPGLSGPFSASEVSGNQSRVEITSIILQFTDKLSQIDTEVGTLHKSELRDFQKYPNCSSGVLTRSRARFKKLRTDPEDITAEPAVTADKSVADHFVQIKKISDPFPTSEAKKSKNYVSRKHVTNKLSEESNEVLDVSAKVRRSSRIRYIKQ